ncbi:flagellar motor switch protein FliN/FliY [Hypnocyclicus thermotrophus]|uniref:Flagellar motor switch protein FliN/FliY n=1 Tax=Hypnocyclicus thermotrophus TaxID=1627895 RepID=A0AA46I5J4_9FUSO|nr:flagellar motor switch phosphatase FliY [Hypnocyclicus thermotrophus]TDT68556.1 flagellar motor switch protein FliN/FliY [Hypnocyclicus thermotrophus]
MEGVLSQEEINALLAGTDLSDEPEESNSSGYNLTKEEADAIGEIGNISLGSSSTALSTLLSKEVQITTPKVSVMSYNDFISESGADEKVLCQIEYRTGFIGLNILIIDKKDAILIGDLMMGNDGSNPPAELDDIYLSAVSEAMNQMMGSSATSLAGMFSKEVDILPPQLTVTDPEEIKNQTEFFKSNDEFIAVSFDMEIENLIKTKIYQIMDINFAKELIDEMFGMMNATSEPPKEEKLEPQAQPTYQAPPQPQAQPTYQAPPQSQAQPMYQAPPQPQAQPMYQAPPQPQAQPMYQPNYNVQPAQFQNFGTASQASIDANLDMIMDIPLRVTVELGRTKLPIKEILDLGAGSIVELDKLAGEPVDILVNGKLIAKGEVVVIDESFGVRITDIVSKMERINKVQ